MRIQYAPRGTLVMRLSNARQRPLALCRSVLVACGLPPLLSRGRMPAQRLGVERGRPVTLWLEGKPVIAYEGETVATVVVCELALATRRTVHGAPRGLYCGMGFCFDCLIVVNGVPNIRACVTLVVNGMRVEVQQAWGPASSISRGA